MNSLPDKLPKATLGWLRDFGYTLNSGDKRFNEIKMKLKESHPYEYYFFIDNDIRELAKDYAENYHCVYVNAGEMYKTWDKRFKQKKKILIKKMYGLEKKGIR